MANGLLGVKNYFNCLPKVTLLVKYGSPGMIDMTYAPPGGCTFFCKLCLAESCAGVAHRQGCAALVILRIDDVGASILHLLVEG